MTSKHLKDLVWTLRLGRKFPILKLVEEIVSPTIFQYLIIVDVVE
jgi:hypothetical protein